MNKLGVIDIIRRGFASAPMPAPDKVMLVSGFDPADSGPPAGDWWYVAKALAGKRWQDLTAADLKTGHSALSMMTPEGVRYYLPAYLILVLNDPEEADFEIDRTRWTISPPPFGTASLEEFEKQISLLSRAERIAVAYFFEYLRRSPEFGFGDDNPLNRVTCYWLKYYRTPLSAEENDLLRDIEPLRARFTEISKEQLVGTIEEAFADAARPVDARLIRPGDRMIVPGTLNSQSTIAGFLRDRRWQSLRSLDINFLGGSLPLMTAEGFRYYLPGFLRVIVEEPDHVLSSTLKSTIWALSPPPFGTSSQQDFDERISLLTHAQRSAINGFFYYLRFNETYLSQFLGDEPYQHLTYFWDSADCYKVFKTTAGLPSDRMGDMHP